MDHGFGAQGGDVIGIVLERAIQHFHGKGEGDAAFFRIVQGVEVHQVRTGDLV